MANNRLYLVNTKTKRFVCLAKSDGGPWGLWAATEKLNLFLGSTFDHDGSCWIVGDENDDVFCEKYLSQESGFQPFDETL